MARRSNKPLRATPQIRREQPARDEVEAQEEAVSSHKQDEGEGNPTINDISQVQAETAEHLHEQPGGVDGDGENPTPAPLTDAEQAAAEGAATGEDAIGNAQADADAIKEVDPNHEHHYTLRPTGVGTSLREQCDCGAVKGVKPPTE